MSPTPHVLLCVENLPLARDHRLRKQVSALHAAGYRVTVVCRRDPENVAPAGVRLRQYRSPAEGASKLGFAREYGYSLAAAAHLIARSYARDRFDAIQASGTPDVYFLLAAPLKALGVRFVFDQRDLSPEMYELRYGRRDRMHRMLTRLERASYRSADHVITVNATLAELARRRGDLPPDRVSVVGNGPALSISDGVEPDPSLRAGRARLCCWIGLLNEQDGVDLALRAVERVVHRHGRTDTHFAFVGDGDARPGAAQLAAALGVDGYVSFPGWLPETTVRRYLATADLGLEPNQIDFVSPVKAMEYMAFGVAFVAFDLAETRRLAGDAAELVRPGDVDAFAAAVHRLLDDASEWERRGRAGQARVATQLCWEWQQQVYLDVFARLLGDRRGTPAPMAAGAVS